jgi:hypothetical protein
MSSKSNGGVSNSRVTSRTGATAAQVHTAVQTNMVPAAMKLSARPGDGTPDPGLVRIHDIVEGLDGLANGTQNYI